MKKLGLYIVYTWHKLIFLFTKTSILFLVLLLLSLFILINGMSVNFTGNQYHDWPEDMNMSFRYLNIGEEASVYYESIPIEAATSLCKGQEVTAQTHMSVIEFICRSPDDNYWIIIHNVTVIPPDSVAFREWNLVLQGDKLVYVSGLSGAYVLLLLVAFFMMLFAVYKLVRYVWLSFRPLIKAP